MSSSSARGRTRNAQAQADLRARRKAYIQTLEDTVSSLEACVRTLRAQSTHSPLTHNSPLESSSSGASELERLRAENARLHVLLADAGLAAAAATRLAKLGKDAPSPASKPSEGPREGEAGERKDDRSWSSTCSITTKRHKLSTMQAFANDVGSQLNAVLPTADISSSSGCTSYEHSFPPTEQELLARAVPSSSTTPSSSCDSIASLRSSPRTPAFGHPTPAQPGVAEQWKADLFDATHSWALAHIERACPPPYPALAPEQNGWIPQADLTAWLQHLNTQPSTLHPADAQLHENSSSASIRVARSPYLLVLLLSVPRPLCKRRQRHARQPVMLTLCWNRRS